MNQYPDDWLCTCGHFKRDHKQLGIINAGPIKPCSLINKNGEWVDRCYNFQPIDNLTLIELTAKAKELK